jgi:glycosyltransferase involved in cell wall biosynthesis
MRINSTENSNLRILNLTEEGRWGGPQARIILIAEQLQKAGFETLVVSPIRDSQEFHKRLHQAGIKHRLLNIHRLTKEKSILLRYFIFFVPELVQLLRLIDDESIDIIYCNGAWQVKGVFAGWLKNIKIVWHLNDTRDTNILHKVFGILSKCVSGFIFTSGATKQCYLSRSSHCRNKGMCEIQAPVDTKYFDPESVNPAVDLLGSGNLKILTIGNVQPGKGIEYFIDMADLLVKKGHSVDFLIAGSHFSNQMRFIEKIRKKIKQYGLQNIQFLGNRADIASVLKASDIYVCASLSESGPMSVWEAMSMAKPIVTTNVGDVVMYIQDGVNGFVVPI